MKRRKAIFVINTFIWLSQKAEFLDQEKFRPIVNSQLGKINFLEFISCFDIITEYRIETGSRKKGEKSCVESNGGETR